MPPKARIYLYISLLISVLAYYILAYHTPRTQFLALLGWFFLACVGYFYLVRASLSFKWGLAIAIGFRLIFLLANPSLSDDYFRFIWDGTLLTQGHNPYLQLPSYYLHPPNTGLVPELTPALFSKLNSPDYYTVYPPICQAFFGIANYIGGSDWWLNGLVLRLFIIAAEIGSIILLGQLLTFFRLPQSQVWWYAFNPLVILELTGNLHFEGVLIFFLLYSLYFLLKNKRVLSAIFLGLAISVKLWPLMFLPFIFRRIGFVPFVRYALIVATLVTVLFLPFVSSELIHHILNSVNLYFQKFEFNASIYYVARWLGYRWTGYNYIKYIGPFLSFITLAGILFLTFRPKKYSDQQFWNLFLFAFSLYLGLATVVHPWYITTLVALAACSGWRFPMVWSVVVILSYATYQTSAYTEYLGLVALEYMVVYGFLIYEWLIRQNVKNQIAHD